MRDKEELEDVLQELCALLVQHGGPNGQTKAEDFVNANIDPPVTRSSLSELDIGIIVGNSKLRHDINFDRELHFRPNLDGAKGRMKRKAQSSYWSALVAELELYDMIASGVTTSLGSCNNAGRLRAASKRRIPRMFEAARDILKALVPESDQPTIDAHLDVTVIMQEIERGICDLSRISRWLCQILKAHCAPMRDSMIDKMVAYVDRGVAERQASFLVEGLVQLFGVMEAMKLDVANHQIRNLRLVLIEDTITFEQKYHCSRIARRRIDPHHARLWFRAQETQATSSLTEHAGRELDAEARLSIFVTAFVNLLLCPFSPEPFPETFNLDTDRMRALRTDINDIFCLDACEKVFVDLLSTIGHTTSVSLSSRRALRSAVSSIINYDPYGASWEDNLDHIVLEVVRQVLLVHSRPLDSNKEAHLRKTAEDALHTIFFDPKRSFFWGRGMQLKEQILPTITRNVDGFIDSSPADVFNAFIVSGGESTLRQRQLNGKVANDAQYPENVITDIVRRISHIAILHWRIWAPLVYLREPERPTAQNTVSTVPLRNSISSRESPAPTQRLSTNSEESWSGGEEGDVKEILNTADVPAAVKSSGVPGSSTVEDGMVAGGMDPASPELYRQRTN
ncbi:Tcp11-domain-containing protein [Rhizodiscina lignyota]|uniref:Tcp11-domain-containing protein n=1 Tax=Rhizodiscina lignyota TaxID=1504668 RepID=A0A9P4IJD6_9PEZI|nr:Tcp11-domain-containing protein [Rhizodiscina lignyota]